MTRGHVEKKRRLILARLAAWTTPRVQGHEKESENACAGTAWRAGGEAGESCGLQQTNGLQTSVSNSAVIGTEGLLESIQFTFFTQEL